jgi:hypothetical protein
MGVLEAMAARVAAGTTVETTRLEVGDIVLARVSGHVYLHLVSALEPGAGRVQIANNRGRVNGWTSRAKVYGICTSVDGVARPRLAGKVLPPPT